MGVRCRVEGGIAFEGDFEFEGDQAEAVLDFAGDDVRLGVVGFGVKPIEAGFVLFEIGIIDEEGFWEDALAVGTSGVEKV